MTVETNLINRLITSASNDVKLAVRNIDMLNINNVDEALSNFYDDQLTADFEMLNCAADILSNALENEEFSSEVSEVLNDRLQIAYKLIDLYNQAWQKLRYGYVPYED